MFSIKLIAASKCLKKGTLVFKLIKLALANIYEINILVSSDPGVVVPFSVFFNNSKCIDNFYLF